METIIQKPLREILERLTTAGTTANCPIDSGASAAKSRRTGLKNREEKIAAHFQPFETRNDPELEAMKAAAMAFTAAMASKDEPAYWLSLLGPSGTGKTMLAKLIERFFLKWLDGFRDERFPTKIVYRKGGLKPWGKVMEEMLDGDYTGMRNLQADWFVGLDDIGAEYQRHRELAVAKLYDVLNARVGRFTVITANLSYRQIGQMLDERIASRLVRNNSVVIELKAGTRDFNLR